MPRISVLMPVYNATRYLREAVDSVLQQTFTDFEYVIIDDGSTDDSVAIINDYTDQRIRLIASDHDFIDSLNKGIQESRGEYIVRMDADDVMLPHRLRTQVDFMEQHPEIDICGSWVAFLGARTGIMQRSVYHFELVILMLLYNPIIHPSVIMRRSVFKRAMYKKGYAHAEDYKLWTDLVIQGFRFANIPEVLLQFRCSEGQVTTAKRQEMRGSALNVRWEYAKQVIEAITRRDERFTAFTDQLVKLVDDNLIGVTDMLQILYQLLLSNPKIFPDSYR